MEKLTSLIKRCLTDLSPLQPAFNIIMVKTPEDAFSGMKCQQLHSSGQGPHHKI